MREFQMPLYNQVGERDADFYDRLEKAGFDLDFNEDGSGLFMKYLRRGSGYYIDVGRRGAGGRRDRAASRPRCLRHWLRLDERMGGRPHVPGGGPQGGQGLGARLRYHEG